MGNEIAKSIIFHRVFVERVNGKMMKEVLK